MVTTDANTAVARIAHATNEVIAIYPITPSSSMGEEADALTAAGVKNIWGIVPNVTEMQSEAGAAAAVHGSLQAGSLTTTFTASQGLLLMIPTMFKVGGELLPTVFHVSARAIAAQGLSIFGDHSDVMSVRSTGFALLCSNNVQEAGDMALVSQAATLASRVPFVHFFDGFRTSSEYQKVEEIPLEQVREMICDEWVAAFRSRAMTPDRPTLRGTAQNPDVYFQGRETVNRYCDATPAVVREQMDRFAALTGRQYRLFEYVGHPEAERVVVMMGSGAEAMHEVVEHLVAADQRVGLVKVRLFQPFSVPDFAAALPKTTRAIAALDRTKEPGALGEPLYLAVRSAVGEALEDGTLTLANGWPTVVGGRYGLGSAEFNAGMAQSVLDNLAAERPKNHFTVGIRDDVSGTSLPWDETLRTEPKGTHTALFHGLGADGTVGANRNTIKIIGEATDYYAQGYFVYDSKKAGAHTISHVRFGKQPIRSTYLIQEADFVACHNFSFLEKYDMLSGLKPGGTFLLASPFHKDEVWDTLPREVQQQLIDRKARFYVIDAIRLAKELGLGAHINVVMQTAYFAISGVLPRDEALSLIEDSVRKTYSKKGARVVQMNIEAAQKSVAAIEEVTVPKAATSAVRMPPPVPAHAPDYVRNVLGEIVAGRGERLPVSAMPVDGVFPVGTTQYEKRNIAVDIPVWDIDSCIQCNQCVFVCPHASIRAKVYAPALLAGAPAGFKHADARGGKELKGLAYTLQVAPEDCTGCGMCVDACPSFAKDEAGNKTDRRAINMAYQPPLREQERTNYDFFLSLPETDPALYKRNTLKGSQFIQPLFEYSGACAGCGETPYVKLVSQLFGDRAIITNATGCSSIYGGNLPTTPYTTRADGRGPAWNNSLFEDTAEATLGVRLAVDRQTAFARDLVGRLAACDCEPCRGNRALFDALLAADQSTQEGIEAQRARVAELKKLLALCPDEAAKLLAPVADNLVVRSIWGFGGDGWAYDIGYGGLDHVLASGHNVNLLVLDTEVYSNTGGQASKATPVGAVAKFAAGGKAAGKKDLGLISMTYGHIYVARVAMGYNLNQTLKAFVEAESYPGPSIVITYSHCIAHGIDMSKGLHEQRKAVESGAWVLYRFDPRRTAQGLNPLQLDSKPPTSDIADYMYGENRFKVLTRAKPREAEALLGQARAGAKARWNLYKQLAEMGADAPAKAAEAVAGE
jgi:pyruvate-ferredoxin/flavodoxin oxidoreductase